MRFRVHIPAVTGSLRFIRLFSNLKADLSTEGGKTYEEKGFLCCYGCCRDVLMCLQSGAGSRGS